MYFCYSYDAWVKGPSAREREWQRHMDWINNNVIGEPEATPFYTVEQLKNMRLVGIYAKD